MCVCVFLMHSSLKFHVDVNFSMIMIVKSIFSTLCILLNCMHMVDFSSLLCSLNKDVLYDYLIVMK